MRVLVVTDRFPPQRGGVAVSALRQARALGPRLESLDVLHLTADLPPGAADHRPEDGFTVHSLGRAPREEDSLQLLERAAEGLVRALRPTVLHGIYAVPTGFVATFVARRLGLPSVVSLRGNDVDRCLYQGSRSSLLLWTLREATRVLAVSRELADKARVLAGREDTLYTPNAVDAEEFSPAPPEDLGPGPVVLFSGELRFKKGLAPLLAALEGLAGQGPPGVRLVLLGGVRKDDQPAFEEWRRAHPEPASRLVVRRYERDPERLRALYSRADLVVLPSLWEGMPNAVLEAMACGRPVLATPVGGVPDLLDHGSTGWLVPLEELDRLAHRIREALAVPAEEREAMGRRAREHVLAHHRPDQERDRILEAYREAAGAPA